MSSRHQWCSISQPYRSGVLNLPAYEYSRHIVLKSLVFLCRCLIDDRARKGWSHTFSKWCVSVHRTIVHVTTPSVVGWCAQSPSPIVLNSLVFLCRCLIDDRARKGWSHTFSKWCVSVHRTIVHVTTPSVVGWCAQSPSPRIVLKSLVFLCRCLIDDRARKGWSHTFSKWCVSVHRTIVHVTTPSVVGWCAQSPSPIVLKSLVFLCRCLIDDRARKGWSHTFSKWCVSVHRTIVHVTTPSVVGWCAQSPSPIVLNSLVFLCRCLIDDRARKGWSHTFSKWCVSVHRTIVHVTTPSVVGWCAQSPSPIVLNSLVFLCRCLIDDRADKGWSHTFSKWCVSVHRTIVHVTTPSVVGWCAQSPSPIVLNSLVFLCRCLIDDRARKGWSHTFSKWCVSVHRTIVHVTTPSIKF